MVNVYVYLPDFIADILLLSSGAQVIQAPILFSFQSPEQLRLLLYDGRLPSRSSKGVDCL